jgi:hypothetical protein
MCIYSRAKKNCAIFLKYFDGSFFEEGRLEFVRIRNVFCPAIALTGINDQKAIANEQISFLTFIPDIAVLYVRQWHHSTETQRRPRIRSR